MSTSASSDHDIDNNMSDSSSSPMPYIRYSPHSFTSQQVPKLATDLTELSCGDNRPQFFNQVNKPCLRITEQPQNQFRFRYVSEMVGTHGCLLGKSVGPNKPKTHPTVELLHYSGKALIRCSLAQKDNPEEHPHKLLEDEQQSADISYPVPDQGSYKVGFGGIGIIHTAKKDVAAVLFKKYSERCKNTNVNLNDLKERCCKVAKTINLNIVRLKFSAHDPVTGEEICPPAFSEPVHNMKTAATNNLKICRISLASGRASGGDDVLIFVEKVKKDDIMIRFFELDERRKEVWQCQAKFMQKDVHHQYAIAFRTPPYKKTDTPVDVHVFIELVRPSDGRTSEAKEFKYKANPVYKQIKKRKAGSPYCPIGSSSRGTLTSGSGGIPLSVVNHQEEQPMEPVPDQSYILPQMHGPIPCNQCDLEGALISASGSDMSHTPLSSLMSSSNSPNCMLMPELPIAELHLDSTEMEQLTLPNCAPGNPLPQEIHAFCNEYLSIYGETLPDQFSVDFVSLVPDSGRAQPQPNQIRLQGDRAITNQNKETDIKPTKADYSAFYKTQNGMEVKKLVKDLCEMIRKGKCFKKSEVRSRLERLFEIRLSNGDTFLHMTLCRNHPSLEYIVKIIHSVKATHLLDCTNDRQQTTLHLAVLNNMPRMVSLFIAKGSNPMIKDDKDLNVIHYAVKYRSCLAVLLDAMKKSDAPYDLDDYNDDKQTALHMAVVSGWQEGTRLLLEYGAKYSVCDAQGRTPLHLAAYDGKLAAVKLLAEATPSDEIDFMDAAGNTALQIVCGVTTMENAVEIARILLEKKAYPLKHEDSNESAWNLVKAKPELKELMKAFVTVGSMDEDDIKSESEDDFESADEGDYPEDGLYDMNLYAREVSVLVDQADAWRVLAERLRLDALLEWYSAQPSPTLTMLKHLKDSRDDVSSKDLAMILEDMGQTEAANAIKRCID